MKVSSIALFQWFVDISATNQVRTTYLVFKGEVEPLVL
jgi:hypothetical protein